MEEIYKHYKGYKKAVEKAYGILEKFDGLSPVGFDENNEVSDAMYQNLVLLEEYNESLTSKYREGSNKEILKDYTKKREEISKRFEEEYKVDFITWFKSEYIIKRDMGADFIYAFMYNSDCCESAAKTISLHRTIEGAENAMNFHKDNIRKDWEKECERYPYAAEYSFDWEQAWFVEPMVVLE